MTPDQSTPGWRDCWSEQAIAYWTCAGLWLVGVGTGHLWDATPFAAAFITIGALAPPSTGTPE